MLVRTEHATRHDRAVYSTVSFRATVFSVAWLMGQWGAPGLQKSREKAVTLRSLKATPKQEV